MSSSENLKKRLADFTNSWESLRKKIISDGSELFHDTSKSIFDEIPRLTAIMWMQYTPYFNDGEPCTFTVHDPTFFFNVDPSNLDSDSCYSFNSDDHETVGDGVPFSIEGFYSNYEDYLKYNEKYNQKEKNVVTKDQYELCSAFSTFLMRQQDLLESLFDDSVLVRITRDGIQVDEYYHD